MLATAVIVLREVLEAALVVSIVLVATRGVVGRGAWISYGILAGTLGALAVAAFADAISAAASGLGQEILDRKSTRLNSSHLVISYAVFCLKKKKSSCFAPDA